MAEITPKNPDSFPPEAAIAITLNGEGFATLMASPFNLGDLAAGFAVSEAIVPNMSKIERISDPRKMELGYTVDLQIPEEYFYSALQRQRRLAGSVGCGLCGVDSLSAARRDIPRLQPSPPPSEVEIAQLMNTLSQQQTLNRRYGGGLHGAALALETGEVVVREDIGRHNAFDKAIGATTTKGTPISYVALTSRCSADLVQKAATCHIPTLVFMASPSDLAVRLAKESNINLLSSQRGHRVVCIHHSGN
ncbi:formate dehydrogenase accessory sulfurtransferase FdhD [Flexibacterium corallicola]|uniref:formate dehydrogenase accessory sulfurtransferase FdhD n=1 Tax=Flexibacterium corallicola TaxID=3037259 RepID=UPI00286EED74|nr:formate dehydrogenase accessory sulfurtransferase FdhD [Pseudovibrio sp. M1P-2-3]